jgi:hypothetical protein
MGSAVSFTISSMVMVFVCYRWGQRYFPVPYQTKSAFFYISTAGILILIDTYVGFTSYTVSVIFSISLCLMFGLMVYLREIHNKRISISATNTDQNK